PAHDHAPPRAPPPAQPARFPYTTLFRSKLERIGVPGVGDESPDSTHIYVLHFRARGPGTYWLVAEPEGGSENVHALGEVEVAERDRKGTRLNSSYGTTSYPVSASTDKKR